MLDIKQDITSLSNFQRNTRDLLHRLKETGRPLVLTVNGAAELVVQDAASYQRLLDRAAGGRMAEGDTARRLSDRDGVAGEQAAGRP